MSIRIIRKRGRPKDIQMRNRETETQLEDIVEALSPAQRIKRRQSMKRHSAKISRARKKAMTKTASKDVLEKRAKKRARKILFDRLAKKEKGELNYATRKKIEDKLKTKKKAIDRLAKKLMKDVRQSEVERKK